MSHWSRAQLCLNEIGEAQSADEAVSRICAAMAAAHDAGRAEALAEIAAECTLAWKRGRAEGIEEAVMAVEETPVIEGRGYQTLERAAARVHALALDPGRGGTPERETEEKT